MEQARFWMWTRRKLSTERSHVQAPTSTYNDSWEEQAFAEDSAGPLGGCIWPPRSYSCSFCRREFRSAQALGGHMNVHRRDRARLKQSPSPQNEILQQNPSTSLAVQYPNFVASPALSPSRISAPSTQENCSEQTLVSPSYSSTIVQEHQKLSLFSAPPSCSGSVAVRVLTVSDSKVEGENKAQAQGEYVKLDTSLNLNLVVRHRNRPTGSGGDDDEGISSKRRRSDATSLPFFLKPSSVDRHHHHLQSEELDLELRLGDRPKRKNWQMEVSGIEVIPNKKFPLKSGN